jgi:hypothetical protein
VRPMRNLELMMNSGFGPHGNSSDGNLFEL